MTEVFKARIDHPSAWTIAQVGGREGFTHRLGKEHIEALDELVARTKHLPSTAVTREQFSTPVIDSLMTAARHQVLNGTGVIVLSGLDIGRYDLDTFERIVWGLGTHIGTGVVQSARRDLVGKVQKEENPAIVRGYTSDLELMPHGDFHEVMALCVFSKAESGGESGLVSTLSIHNEIFANRPDLLEPLYEGFYQDAIDRNGVTPTKIPVYCCVDGKVSCYGHLYFTLLGAQKLGVPLPAQFKEAMDYYMAESRRPDLWARFMLEPGEMLFWHNFTNLHSREGFKNSAQNKRLLLRLWLNLENGRPMVPEFSDRRKYMDIEHAQGRHGVLYARLERRAPERETVDRGQTHQTDHR